MSTSPPDRNIVALFDKRDISLRVPCFESLVSTCTQLMALFVPKLVLHDLYSEVIWSKVYLNYVNIVLQHLKCVSILNESDGKGLCSMCMSGRRNGNKGLMNSPP